MVMYAGGGQRQADDFQMSPVDRTTKPTKAEVAARIREAGKRAKQEAEARRKNGSQLARPKELGGQKGPEPTRYGDWEKKGIASDF
jgi:hypothetical protein